jgi:hypothetical protein
MAYILNKTDGTPLITIPDKSTTGTDYSVTFIGKNYVSYGEALNESLLHLLENSASNSSDRPANPVLGQTWYNKTNKTLYVCYAERGGTAPAKFQALANSNTSSNTPENPSPGDLWYDPAASGKLKLYVGPPKGWITVGPQVQSDWGQADINQIDYIKNRPETFAPALRILYGSNELTEYTTKTINFTGDGVTANLVNGTVDTVVVNIPGGGGGGGAATVAISPAAPANPTVGELWYENATIGRAFVYNGSEWVDFSPAIGGGPAAPAPAPAPTNIPIAASTSFTLATTDGSAKIMGVVLTPGTWQVILDTRIGSTTNYGGAFTATQSATVGATTVSTQVRIYNGSNSTQVSGDGIFKDVGTAIVDIITRQLNKDILNSTSDIAVGEFTITVDTPVVMDMKAVVVSDPILQSIGSTLTLSKIASTDAQKIYSGTMPTFTVSTLGVGQKWVKLTPGTDRRGGIEYRNDTGKPIFVSIHCIRSSDGATFILNVDGVQLGGGNGSVDLGYNYGNCVGGVVPAGSIYKLSTSGSISIQSWAELR